MIVVSKVRNSLSFLLDQLYYAFSLPKINVESTDMTLDLLLNKQISIARFGDGEFDLIDGKSITYQKASTKLSNQLKSILFEDNDQLLIGIPDFFDDISRYTKASKRFWKHDIRKRRALYKQIAATHHTFASAQISRPYMNIKDKSLSKKYFGKLKKIWNGRDILIVEGETSRSGIGNDLFSGARSVTRIICPSKNAYSKINKIEESILQCKEDRLILLMLGPTAKIIVNDLAEIKNQMIDIGHIDSEYEWFLRRDLVKTKLPNKHTAEFNNDSNLKLNNDPEYEREIVAKVLPQ